MYQAYSDATQIGLRVCVCVCHIKITCRSHRHNRWLLVLLFFFWVSLRAVVCYAVFVVNVRAAAQRHSATAASC